MAVNSELGSGEGTYCSFEQTASSKVCCSFFPCPVAHKGFPIHLPPCSTLSCCLSHCSAIPLSQRALAFCYRTASYATFDLNVSGLCCMEASRGSNNGLFIPTCDVARSLVQRGKKGRASPCSSDLAFSSVARFRFALSQQAWPLRAMSVKGHHHFSERFGGGGQMGSLLGVWTHVPAIPTVR